MAILKVKNEPVRTCIVCRRKRRKENLIRFVLNKSGNVVIDDRMTKPGRGAYVCYSPACLEKLGKDKRLSRALKIKDSITSLSGNIKSMLHDISSGISDG